MSRVVRAAVLLLIAIAVVILSTNDGRAQEGGATLTITVEVEDAIADDTFQPSVDVLDGDGLIETSPTIMSPVTLDLAGSAFVDLFQEVPVGWRFARIFCGSSGFPELVDTVIPVGEQEAGIPLTVPDGEDVGCLLTYVEAPTGTLRLTRVVEGDDPDPLARHRVSVGPRIDPQPLRTGETIDFTVNAGPVFFIDFAASGYGTFLSDCGGADMLFEFGTGVEVEVPAGGVVACSIRTIANPVATLTIEKLVERDGGDLRFPFQTGGIQFELRPSLAIGFGRVEFALGPGSYEFVELATEGWFLQSAGCSGFGVELIDQGVRITPEQGGNVECTFINARIDEAPELGDANCDGSVDIIDALVIAQFEAQVRAFGDRCPLTNPAGEIWGPTADVDTSGTIDIIDALVVARCSAGLPAPLCPAE